jgi:hypothetical protein
MDACFAERLGERRMSDSRAGATTGGLFTQTDPSDLEVSMEDDAAYFDYLEAREVALQAAVGYFAVANIPTEHLREIAAKTTDSTIALAAKVVLYQRGEGEEMSDSTTTSTTAPLAHPSSSSSAGLGGGVGERDGE